MKDNKFDPNMFKQLAQSMAQNMSAQSNEAQQNEQMKEKIQSNLTTADTVVCENCGHHLFVNSFVLKRISALISPTGEEILAPVQVFACTKCEHVNSDFLPSYAIADIKKTDKNGVPTF
jgi:DNA-directed RNA polymerase subunit RPC12/RpoP